MGRFARLAAWFAMLVGLCVSMPAVAADIAPACHTFSSDSATYAELAARPEVWTCNSTHWKDRRPAGWLRFDARDWHGRMEPVTFVTRITKFDRMTLLLVRPDGS